MTEAKIEIDEINLEDAIVLGNDKLVNISIEYPRENEDGDVIETVKTRAKIKQLTMKELKNINVDRIDLESSVNILRKSLFKQDETPFSRELILNLPVGVSISITREILRISGVKNEDDIKGF